MTQKTTPFVQAVSTPAAKIAALLITTLVVIAFLINIQSMGDLLFFPMIFVFAVLIHWLSSVLYVRFTHKITTDPATKPFDPQSPALPNAVITAIKSHVPVLESLGFRPAAHLVKPRPTQVNAELYLTLCFNHESGQVAWLLTVTLKTLFAPRPVSTLTFVTEFTDGTVLSTGNGYTPLLTPVSRQAGSMSLPTIRNPHYLYSIHQRTLEHLYRGASRRDLSQPNPFDYQKEATLRELSRVLAAGDYVLDYTEKWYRPTWKGAVLISSRYILPVAPILNALRQWRQSRLIRELGLERPFRDPNAHHFHASNASQHA